MARGWWPLQRVEGGLNTVFDDTYWSWVDAEVETARAAGDSGALLEALLNAYRFPEAHDVLREWTSHPDAPADVWITRGALGLLVGDVTDAYEAYGRAHELDPTLPMPTWWR